MVGGLGLPISHDGHFQPPFLWLFWMLSLYKAGFLIQGSWEVILKSSVQGLGAECCLLLLYYLQSIPFLL